MPHFGDESEEQLATIHPDLQKILRCAIQWYDFRVVEGARDPARGAYLASINRSEKGALSLHCTTRPSRAVDIAPWPIDWDDKLRFAFLAGQVVAIGEMLGIGIRWGGDWDSDGNQREHALWDGGHFELVDSDDDSRLPLSTHT